jgi:hypothetical protein
MKSLKILSISLLTLLCIGQSNLQARHGGAIAGGILGGLALGSVVSAANRHNYYDDGYYYGRHYPRYYRDDYYYSDNYDESDERRTALEEENALLRRQVRASKEKQHEKSVRKTMPEHKTTQEITKK